VELKQWEKAAVAPRAEDEQPAWKPLFDGKTMIGWHEFGE
jgi:hypothetical protein